MDEKTISKTKAKEKEMRKWRIAAMIAFIVFAIVGAIIFVIMLLENLKIIPEKTLFLNIIGIIFFITMVSSEGVYIGYLFKKDYFFENIEDAVGASVDRLAELEDKIEQGTLIELPCKVGDKIFVPWEWNNEIGIAEVKIISISINEAGIFFGGDMESDDDGFLDEYGGQYTIYQIGKTVFFTREEAERQLNAEEKEIRGACGQEEYCCCYNQAKDCCENADCEHFIPLNDFSEEAHKSEMELQKEKTEQA